VRPVTRLLPLAIFTMTAVAQKPAPLHRPHPATLVNPAAQLPITRVALYKNGVGFFELTGRVTGDEAVTIDFTSAQLNDVLQSLTAIDLNGGRISGANYNSTTPLDQQLKTLPLNLTADPTDVDFYNAIRGARVEVRSPAGSITGRLLSIDLRASRPAPKDGGGSDPDRRFITVVAETGEVKTLELTPATSVTLLDTALHQDVSHYLQLLAENRSQGLRHLTLTDRGAGTRELRVSYISEVPVWKSTYRILFSEAKTAGGGGAGKTPLPAGEAILQGWSVVDNTTGSDWTNVHLDLIAGAPQSFIQPLSTPYYNRRPEIPLPQEAQLTPQTHESGESDATDSLAAPQKISKAVEMQMQSVTGNGVAEGIGGGININGAMGAPFAMAGRTRMAGASPMAAARAPLDYAEAAQSSIAPQTSTAAFDDFFEYSITDPITIRKNESALVPILQTRLPIERVTLWADSDPVALRALWLTNSSTLTLDRGSFAIVENGSFGGEGLLDPIHPGERRLLSYAADQAVRVTHTNPKYSRKVQRLTIANGVLTETTLDVQEETYDIRNAAPESRTVILEHFMPGGYTLDSEPKPAETVPGNNGTLDRFRVVTASGETEHLHVGQRRTEDERIRLVDRTEDQLILLLRNAGIGPAAMQQLQPVFDAHHVVIALDEQIRDRQTEIADITRDQERLRENLKALKGTPEEKALATRYTGELNTQEDRLADLNKQIADLKTQRAAADADFNARLQAVQFDRTL
jgi:hypothetical protein